MLRDCLSLSEGAVIKDMDSYCTCFPTNICGPHALIGTYHSWLREYLITALKQLPGNIFYLGNSLNPIRSGRTQSLTTYLS